MTSNTHEDDLVAAPLIRYNGEVNGTHRSHLWSKTSTPHHRFVRPSRGVAKWVVCVFEDSVPCGTTIKFIEAFLKAADIRGFELRKPAEIWRLQKIDMKALEERARYYITNGVQFVLYVCESQESVCCHVMEEMEIRYGFLTQSVSRRTVFDWLGNAGDKELEYMVMQTNLKLGGLNYELSSSPEHPAYFVERNLLPRGRMFIGLHVHKEPESKNPATVGMSYTLSSSCEERGGYWYQPANLDHITELKTWIDDAICNYKRHYGGAIPTQNCYPAQIIVYRAGSTIEEMQKVVNEEIPQILAAFENKSQWIQGTLYPYKPHLTVLFAQWEDKAKMPSLFEEFTHSVTVASLRTSRYVLVYGGHAGQLTFNTKLLKNVTHALCHMHQSVDYPGERPNVMTSAAVLAKRGRNNWTSKFLQRRKHEVCECSEEDIRNFNMKRLRGLPTRWNTKYWA